MHGPRSGQQQGTYGAGSSGACTWVVPPLEKVATPTMVVDHESRRYSLCGRNDNLILESALPMRQR
jgi:hypothetical protein